MAPRKIVNSRFFMGMQVMCLISVFHSKLPEMWVKQETLTAYRLRDCKSKVKVLVDCYDEVSCMDTCFLLGT